MTPIEKGNVLLESREPLSTEQKRLFGYFGENAKILPPFRILNPQNIIVGDRVAIRDGCHVNAFIDLTFIHDYVDPAYRNDFEREQYLYDGRIEFGHTCQVGRFFFVSCTKAITLGDHVTVSERVFLGDNNHGFSHPHVPIMQQPNKQGDAITIGSGSWIGVGAALLPGVRLGRNTVVGANSVVHGGSYPSHAVIGTPPATVLFRRHGDDD